MLSGIGGSLRSIGTIAGGILTSQVFMAIANQIGNMSRAAFDAVSQFQSMQMMLTNLQARELIRSGDFEDMNAALRAAAPLAEATMNQLARIATLSPYQLENVSNTYKMAMAFGFSAKESTVFTDALLNMAAGVGANGEMLDRMAYNLAQVRMQGKVTAMDIRQLAMAGFDLVDVLKYVGKQMDVNIQTHEDFNRAIATGQITWEDFTKYFAEYADKNFGGASERMSRTLEGLKSTFKDVFMLTMPKILGPAADIITGYLNDILNKFMAFANSGALEQIGQKLADIFNSPFLQNGILGLTRGFENWSQNVDWEGLSQDLAAGIDSIDWATLGKRAAEGAGNIANGIREAITEIDWGALSASVGNGFMNFMAGLTGQGSWENVKATWSSNWEQFKLMVANDMFQFQFIFGSLFGAAIFNGMQTALTVTGGAFQLWLTSFDNLKYSIVAKLTDTGTAMSAAMGAAVVNMTTTGGLLLGAGLTSMLNVIYMWNSQVVIALQSLKQRFIAEIQQMLQGAVRFIEEKTEWVVTAIATLISAMRRAVKPINITVGLPDWEGLAKQIEEGVAILNAAMKGLKSMSVGVAGAGVAAGGNMGAFGGMRAGGGTKGFAGGGISTGSRSGHWELLHGTEAVIPLERGNVPISLNGGLMPNQGGGVVVNFYHQPMISVGTEREARETIAPIVADVVRGEFQKRGI